MKKKKKQQHTTGKKDRKFLLWFMYKLPFNPGFAIPLQIQNYFPPKIGILSVFGCFPEPKFATTFNYTKKQKRKKKLAEKESRREKVYRKCVLPCLSFLCYTCIYIYMISFYYIYSFCCIYKCFCADTYLGWIDRQVIRKKNKKKTKNNQRQNVKKKTNRTQRR